MPRFTIQVPDGRKVTVEAADQDQALSGIQQWYATEGRTNNSGSPDDRSSTPPQLPQQSEPYNQGYLSQGLSGINEGIANGLGAPVDLAATGINLGTGGLNKLFGTSIPQITDPFGGAGTFRRLMAPTITPETTDPTKQFVRRAAQDVGASMLPSGLGSKIANDAGLLTAQLGMGLFSGTGAATAEALFPGNKTAEAIGEGLGVGTGLGSARLAQKLLTPFENTATRQAAVDLLKKEGVDLTAGQKTGSKWLQYQEAGLSGDAASAMTDKQAEQFTSAVLKRAGTSGRATPDVVDQAFTNNGNELDSLAARNVLPMDGQLSTDLSDAIRVYNGNVNPSQRAPVIQDTLQDLVNAAKSNGNQLTGAAYQKLRSRLERSARGTSDPELSTALRGIKGALDDAMERGMAASGSPDLGAWRDARGVYRNLLVVEKAASGAGEKAASGLISPAALRAATKAIYGTRSYARGKTDYSDLAHAGEQTMTPLPQSGTAPRLATKLAATGPVAAAATLAAGQPIPAAILAAGSVAPWLLGKALMTKPAQAYLSNQLLRGKKTPLTALIGPAGGIAANQLALGNALAGGTP